MEITRNRFNSFDLIDSSINGRTLYHGKVNSDIFISPKYLYLYPNPENASVFAEHSFYNSKGCSITSESEYFIKYLESNPVVIMLRASVSNTALIDFKFFEKYSKSILPVNCDVVDLFDKFEESEYRNEFLDHLKEIGFDSAVILNDVSPEDAGGDWGYKESFILFYPDKQIIA